MNTKNEESTTLLFRSFFQKQRRNIVLIGLASIFYLSTAFQPVEKESSVVLSNIESDTLAACYLLEEKNTLVQEGNHQAALIALEKAQKLYTQHNQWERAIQCVVELAKLVDNFDAVELKIKYGNLGLQLAQKYLPEDHPLTAAAFRQKAEALMNVPSLDSANYYLTKAISIFEQHQIWTELGWTEILIGYNYFLQYQLDSCQHHYQKVEELLQQQVLLKTTQTNIHSTLLSLRGPLYERQGDYDKAIQNTKKALQLDIDKGVVTALDSSFISHHYNNLGTYYYYKGDYQRAIDNFIQAINSSTEALQNPAILSNMGELLRKKNKYAKSIEYLKKSLKLSSAQDKMDVLQGLGVTYQKLGLIDSAVYYFQEAIRLSINYRKPIALYLLGNIHVSESQLDTALHYLKLAEKSYLEDSTASQHSSFFLSNIYRSIGEVYALHENFDTALVFYQKSLVENHTDFTDSLNFESNPPLVGIYDSRYFWKTMQGKARVLAKFPNESKKLKASLASYQVLIQWMDSLQASHATETASLDWSSEFKQIYEEAIEVAFRLYQSTQKTEYLNLAFSFSEKSKNSLLLESLKAAEGKAIVGVPDSLLQKEKDLNIDIAFYEKVLRKAQDEKETAKEKLYQNYLSKSRLQLVKLRENLERDFPKFHALKYGGTTTSIAKVQAELVDEKTAFLEYFVGDSSAYVFVITPRKAHFLQLEAPIQLQKKSADFRQTLLNPTAFRQNAKNAFADYQTKAYDLYESVLQPVLSILPSEVQQFIIVSDDFLNTLPFEVLTQTNETTGGFDFAKLPYLLYDYQLQYAYSADLLLQNQTRQNQLQSNTQCLAFAPSYKKTGAMAERGGLRNVKGNLQGTALEIQAISDFFDGKFDIGKTATERQFKQLAPQFGLLHLAMHGVPDFDNANFNHLKFSNMEADSVEDNLLHHYEIANMDLQAQLVVLSACETGLGKYEKGEGVYSLARSFMYAGVPSVVMSLWKVSDASTSELMPYFYESLKDGLSKERALQAAKVRFLEEANLEYRHPFYWSAFVMMGDNTAIEGGYKNWIWWLVIGGVVLVGMVILWIRKRTFV